MANKKNINFFKKIFYISVMLNNIFLVVLFLLKDNIFYFLFKISNLESVFVVFDILLISLFFVLPSMLIGYPLLGGYGASKYANFSVVYAAILNIIFIILLVLNDKLDMYSIAYTTMGVELFIFIYRTYWVKRKKIWG